jgi:ATP-dependent DNA helicase RecQ
MPAPTDQHYALELLRRALSNQNADFRDGQWEAIDAIVNQRRKMLVVQRTGWGKSSVYFIATRILRDRGHGPTLIVSPLLALMRNQIEAAERLGIRPVTINSTNRDDWQPLIQTILNNQADAVLISPERLANDEFVRTVLLPVANQIGLLVVDEAHCISDWGHDFRPDYRRLVSVLQHMPPNMAVLGTTATANNRVLDDITSQLGNIDIQRGSLLRETLALQTVKLPDQSGRLAWLAEHLPQLPGTGIVYTLTKRDADQVAEWLTLNGITAKAYYSGVEADDFESSDAYRQHLESALLNNEIKALVATTALGIGYDKPDLGFVIHYQAPSSIVAYYQQVGRAGRAIDYAVGVLLSGREDQEIQEFFRASAFPDERHVNSIMDALADCDGLSDRAPRPAGFFPVGVTQAGDA